MRAFGAAVDDSAVSMRFPEVATLAGGIRTRPFPLVIAAPSGTGKTSLAKALVERNERLVFSVSATTRRRRPGEVDGQDYLFVDDAEFDRMVESGELVEFASVHDNRYGTPRQGIAAALERGKIAVLDIDVQGARQIRAAFSEAVLVFILPPSGRELFRRLTGRRSEDAVRQRRRLDKARDELRAAPEFDYLIVNDDFDAALATLEAVVIANSRHVRRLQGLDAELGRLGEELEEILRRSG